MITDDQGRKGASWFLFAPVVLDNTPYRTTRNSRDNRKTNILRLSFSLYIFWISRRKLNKIQSLRLFNGVFLTVFCHHFGRPMFSQSPWPQMVFCGDSNLVSKCRWVPSPRSWYIHVDSTHGSSSWGSLEKWLKHHDAIGSNVTC